MNIAEVYAKLNKAVKEHGSQKAYADHIGVSASYLHDVLAARREPGKSILRALGLRKVATYEENKEN